MSENTRMSRRVKGGYMVPTTVRLVDGATGTETVVHKEMFMSDTRVNTALDYLYAQEARAKLGPIRRFFFDLGFKNV